MFLRNSSILVLIFVHFPHISPFFCNNPGHQPLSSMEDFTRGFPFLGRFHANWVSSTPAYLDLHPLLSLSSETEALKQLILPLNQIKQEAISHRSPPLHKQALSRRNRVRLLFEASQGNYFIYYNVCTRAEEQSLNYYHRGTPAFHTLALSAFDHEKTLNRRCCNLSSNFTLTDFECNFSIAFG